MDCWWFSPSVGPGTWATRAIQINANGQGPFRFRTFCINQLGNIGGGVRNSMFGHLLMQQMAVETNHVRQKHLIVHQLDEKIW